MVNQVLVRVGCKLTRTAMPAASGEENERMLCTCKVIGFIKTTRSTQTPPRHIYVSFVVPII